MAPRTIGRIDDRHVAFWHVARFLTTHPNYRKVPFARMKIVQEAIARGDYFVLGDGKTIDAVATWQPIDLAELLRLHKHVPHSSESINRIYLTSLAAIDRASLKMMIQKLRANFSDKDVYWNRHQGKLGHRPANLGARAP